MKATIELYNKKDYELIKTLEIDIDYRNKTLIEKVEEISKKINIPNVNLLYYNENNIFRCNLESFEHKQKEQINNLIYAFTVEKIEEKLTLFNIHDLVYEHHSEMKDEYLHLENYYVITEIDVTRKKITVTNRKGTQFLLAIGDFLFDQLEVSYVFEHLPEIDHFYIVVGNGEYKIKNRANHSKPACKKCSRLPFDYETDPKCVLCGNIEYCQKCEKDLTVEKIESDKKQFGKEYTPDFIGESYLCGSCLWSHEQDCISGMLGH
jgi:hypothetical protein